MHVYPTSIKCAEVSFNAAHFPDSEFDTWSWRTLFHRENELKNTQTKTWTILTSDQWICRISTMRSSVLTIFSLLPLITRFFFFFGGEFCCKSFYSSSEDNTSRTKKRLFMSIHEKTTLIFQRSSRFLQPGAWSARGDADPSQFFSCHILQTASTEAINDVDANCTDWPTERQSTESTVLSLHGIRFHIWSRFDLHSLRFPRMWQFTSSPSRLQSLHFPFMSLDQ